MVRIPINGKKTKPPTPQKKPNKPNKSRGVSVNSTIVSKTNKPKKPNKPNKPNKSRWVINRNSGSNLPVVSNPIEDKDSEENDSEEEKDSEIKAREEEKDSEIKARVLLIKAARTQKTANQAQKTANNLLRKSIIIKNPFKTQNRENSGNNGTQKFSGFLQRKSKGRRFTSNSVI